MLYSDAAYNALKTQHLEIARSLLDQAVPLAGEPEHRVPLAYLCGNRGLEALFTGDFERAGDAFREELQLSQEHVLPRPAAEGLAGLAAIASRRGQLKRAAQVLGAAAAQAPIADPDVTAQLEEQFFGPARAAYGERRWSEAEAEGERLNLNQAIALALTPNRTLG